MPIYEYGCAKCGETFEAWQKVSDAPVKKCELCGSRRVSRLISASTFHLKGSGWYITDYARKGKGGGESAPSKPDTKPEKKSSEKKKSESKAGAASAS